MAIPIQQPLYFNKLGGMQTHIPEPNYPEHGAVLAKNCRIPKIGEVKRRLGAIKYNSDEISRTSSNIIQGLYQYLYGSIGNDFLVANNGVLYKDNGTGARTSLKSSLNTSARFSFDTYDNFCWITNGVDTNMKYDGTSVTNMCIVKPASNVTISGQTTGGKLTLLNTYRFVVTFYNSTTGQESNPYTLSDSAVSSITLTGSNNAITGLTSIPTSSDAQVNARRIYRTTGNDTILNARLAYTLADNTTDYINAGAGLTALNQADSTLGKLIPLDYDTAPIFTKLVIHNNKGIGITGTDSILYVSKENNVWYYPQAQLDPSLTANDFTIGINDGDGDFITNIVPYYNSLIVFKQNSIWILDGYDQSDFSVRRVEFEYRIGCVNKETAIVWKNWCYFLDKSGIFRTTGQMVHYIGEPLEAFFNPNNSQTDEKINSTYITKATCIMDKTKPNDLIKFSIPSNTSQVNDLHLLIQGDDFNMSYDTGYNATCYGIKKVGNIDYVIRGDDYGYVWVENQQEGEGALDYSYATSATNTTLVDSLATWVANSLRGCYVEILSGTGEGQKRLVTANDTTSVTVATWDTNPDDTSVYTIGGIDFWYVHKWDNYNAPSLDKRLKYIDLYIDNLGGYPITCFAWFNFVKTSDTDEGTPQLTQSLWDVAFWDEDIWDSEFVNQRLIRTPPSKIHDYSTFGIRHKPAGQPVIFKGYAKIYQVKGQKFK